jgi:hypothetical protein
VQAQSLPAKITSFQERPAAKVTYQKKTQKLVNGENLALICAISRWKYEK